MPASSKKMRRASAIAEHHPEMLYKRNRGMKKMSKGELHEYASTPEAGLPEKAPPESALKRLAGRVDRQLRKRS